MLSWLLLVLAGLLETVWAVGLRYTDGFSRFWPSVGTIVAMVLSFWLLERALRTIPLGPGYAVWVSIGILGTTLYGIWVLGEPLSLPRAVAMLTLGLSVVALKMTA